MLSRISLLLCWAALVASCVTSGELEPYKGFRTSISNASEKGERVKVMAAFCAARGEYSNRVSESYEEADVGLMVTGFVLLAVGATLGAASAAVDDSRPDDAAPVGILGVTATGLSAVFLGTKVALNFGVRAYEERANAQRYVAAAAELRAGREEAFRACLRLPSLGVAVAPSGKNVAPSGKKDGKKGPAAPSKPAPTDKKDGGKKDDGSKPAPADKRDDGKKGPAAPSKPPADKKDDGKKGPAAPTDKKDDGKKGPSAPSKPPGDKKDDDKKKDAN